MALEDGDIERIVQAVKSGGPIPGGQEMEKDVKKDLALIQESVEPIFAQVSEALTILADAVSELKERLDCMEGEFGGFTSGLTGIIDKRNKSAFTGMLKEKFPDFGRFQDLVRRLYNVDVYEDLEMKSTDSRTTKKGFREKSKNSLMPLNRDLKTFLYVIPKRKNRLARNPPPPW
jgi:hypothetical protein